jgi:6-phosphogluconolactonase
MKNFTRLTVLLFISICFAFTSCKKEYRLFVGGYTTKDEESGMSVFNFNTRNGSLESITESDVGENPSYFCYSAKYELFYIINEVMEFRGNFGGGLAALKYDKKSNQFEKISDMPIPYGGPCFISMSADNRYLFMANYPKGSIAVVRLDEKGLPLVITDTILYVKEEPEASHAHMILSDPAGEHVYVTDLGLDRIVVYDFDSREGKMNQIENGIAAFPKGSGPRHFTFSSDGTMLYVINELGSTIAVFSMDNKNGLTCVQTLSSVRGNYSGQNYCADIHLGKNGRYLYGSNRGENTIVTFKVGIDGLLKLAGHTSCGGNWPRNFTIDPSGKYLLVGNQKSDTVSVFRIDRKTGLPSKLSGFAAVRSPACLKFFDID